MANERPELVSRFALPLLVVAAFVPALGSLGAPFYWVDDHSMIVNNPAINGSAPLSGIFTKAHFGHYAPLHELLIWAQWQVFGAHAIGYRLFSVLLHAGAALACFTMLKNLTRRPTLALGVAALWAVHPIQPESVAWITEQKTLWCGLFSFAALALYFNTDRSRAVRIVGGLLLIGLAGLGKSPALVVGPLVLLYELCAPLLPGTNEAAPKRNLLATLPFLALAALFAYVALRANHDTEDAIAWSARDTVLNLPGTLLIYLRTAFLPWTVSFFQDLDRVLEFSDPAFFGKLIAVIALFAAGIAIAGAAQRKLFIFCALAWALALGPMLNVSATTFPAYDRFQYMALPFLFLGAALLVEVLLKKIATARGEDAFHPPVWALVLLVVGVLGFMRGMLFASEINVMLDATQKAPRNAFAYGQFANSLFPEWTKAATEHKPDEMRTLALTIASATDKARHCWNFNEFYVTPGPLLVTTGQALRASGLAAESIPFFEAALDPRFARFKAAVEEARKQLATLKANDER